MTREFVYTKPFLACWKAMGLTDEDTKTLEVILLNNTEQGDKIPGVPSPKKQTKNTREKLNEKNDKYDIKLLYSTAFIPRFA